MISTERFAVFASSFDEDLSPELEQIRTQASKKEIPIIRREMQAFLRFLLHVCHPSRILEIGTGTGFSSLFMLSCLPQTGAVIDTIEYSEQNACEAEKNIRRLGAQGRINLIRGDAGSVIPKLEQTYGLIFLDGPKGQYSRYLDDLVRLLEPGGILAADNVLKGGEIMDSRYAAARRQRTIHARMHDYLYRATHDGRLVSSIIPLGDGVCVSVRQPDRASGLQSDP